MEAGQSVTQILLTNCSLITMNSKREIYDKGWILIENDIIKSLGTSEDTTYLLYLSPSAEIYNLEDKIVLPGLINTHVHTCQQLARGIADDVDLITWLTKHVWIYEEQLTYEDVLLSATACCVELIRTGVTTFLEAGGQFVEAIADAVERTGLRACLAKSVMDCGEGLPEKLKTGVDDEISYQENLYKLYNNAANGRIKIWFGIRTIFNVSNELLIKTKELADKYNTGIHMHVAEISYENDFVMSHKQHHGTVDLLNSLGILGHNLLAVHAVWVTSKDIDLLRMYNVKVSHCPSAAMKVSLGFAPVPEMLNKGIPVSIGTDGAPSNNRMDMFRDMFLASVIHKGRLLDPKVVSAMEILEMATINGAKCGLMENEIGSLEVGKKADLCIVNSKSIHILPMNNHPWGIVYSMSSQEVESVICDGKWLMKDRVIQVLDENALLDEIKTWKKAKTIK